LKLDEWKDELNALLGELKDEANKSTVTNLSDEAKIAWKRVRVVLLEIQLLMIKIEIGPDSIPSPPVPGAG
jgi:hypothetical protein